MLHVHLLNFKWSFFLVVRDFIIQYLNSLILHLSHTKLWGDISKRRYHFHFPLFSVLMCFRYDNLLQRSDNYPKKMYNILINIFSYVHK